MATINTKQLLVDAFKAKNLVVFKDNADMVAALNALTVDTLNVTGITVDGVKRTAKISDANNVFKGEKQSWSPADVHAQADTVPEERHLANLQELTQQTQTGFYAYGDGEILVLGYVYDHEADEATAAAQLIADYEALGYTAPAGGLARVENNVVLDGDYVAGTITAAAKVVPPAEPVAIPDTDYGTLEFPVANVGV